jgi:hypothetical protein
MRHGIVVVQVQIVNDKRVVRQGGYGVPHHAVETRGILHWIRHAGGTPHGVPKDGVPFARYLADETKVAVAAAVVGDLFTQVLDCEVGDGVVAHWLSVVLALEGGRP